MQRGAVRITASASGRKERHAVVKFLIKAATAERERENTFICNKVH